MAAPGYVKLWRSSAENALYFSEPFTKWQAWCDLLLLANYKSRTVYVRGIAVNVEAGQVLAADHFLAYRWQWSRNKVRRFTSYLSSKTIQQISIQKSNVCTVITVLNWANYQTDDTANDTAERQQTIHTKEGKEGREGKKRVYTDDFSRWWAVYKKGSKAHALSAWKKQRITPDMVPALIDATGKYKAYCTRNNRLLKDGQGWLNGRYWENEWTDAAQGTKLAADQAEASAPRKPDYVDPDDPHGLKQRGSADE